MKSNWINTWFIFFIATTLATGCSPADDPTPAASLEPTLKPVQVAQIDLNPNSIILPLPADELDDAQRVAQAAALNSENVQSTAISADGVTHLRSEVFTIYPARASDVTAESEACATAVCYRVDIYNFAHNATFIALVDVETATLVDLGIQTNATPDLPARLVQRAVEIATTAEEVIAELGFDPAPDDPTMPNVKTAFNNTKCERSQHLCVAPTFIVGERALWAIVDLVDEQVVATRWTDLGDFSAGLPTEELIAREEIFAGYCEQETSESRSGWSFNYMLTSTDGLRLSDVSFNDVGRFRSIKLVDYHVSYSEREGFGYSDAVGCPMFSSAAVVALDAPFFEPIFEEGSEQAVGFALNQDYVHPQWPQPCNYRYMQRYEFYNDGRLRVMAANLGRGCGSDATYRFLYRIDPVDDLTFSAWDGSSWNTWQDEQWELETGKPTTNAGARYRIANSTNDGYAMLPNRGQFGDGSLGDNAFVYVTRHQIDEGDADMVTLGVCCNSDHEQGPETFIDGESITAEDLVIWYVPQIENNDAPGQEYCWADQVVENGMFVPRVWPCWAGPMFVPLK